MLLQACAATSPVEERFSDSTATTWRVAGNALVFEHTEARYSRSARDYVYLGPVALNIRGTFEYFLWVGIGSTLDRGFLAPEANAPETMTLFIDGEPLELVLTPWSQRVPGLATETPYEPSVTLQWHMATRVTRNQIALIDSRGIDHLLLHAKAGEASEFARWGNVVGWQAFVSESP
jgi:hypothetical protein